MEVPDLQSLDHSVINSEFLADHLQTCSVKLVKPNNVKRAASLLLILLNTRFSIDAAGKACTALLQP